VNVQPATSKYASVRRGRNRVTARRRIVDVGGHGLARSAEPNLYSAHGLSHAEPASFSGHRAGINDDTMRRL